MIKNNELFYEPVQILDELNDISEYSSEMSEKELAFMCGLIKKNHPQKIVEIGVAAGGTTSVILNCISMLNIKTQMFSVDLRTDFYGDKKKKTGYLAEKCKKILNREIDHTLYTGDYAVNFMDRIGDNIDFLILDTVHSIPGELLDFLVIYPLLKQGAVVVLHDIALNHCHNQVNQIATKVLFDTVVAEKLYALNDDGALLNIGAFIINADTDKYIDNVFSVLTLTWKYQLQTEELFFHRNCYSKYYSKECLELFDLAVNMNQRTLEESRNDKKKLRQEEFLKLYRWIEMLKCKGKEVYIYGAGYFGQKLYDFLDKCSIGVKGYIISDGQNRNEMKNVCYLSEVNIDADKEVVLLGTDSSLHAELGAKLLEFGIQEYIVPEKYVYSYLI